MLSYPHLNFSAALGLNASSTQPSFGTKLLPIKREVKNCGRTRAKDAPTLFEPKFEDGKLKIPVILEGEKLWDMSIPTYTDLTVTSLIIENEPEKLRLMNSIRPGPCIRPANISGVVFTISNEERKKLIAKLEDVHM